MTANGISAASSAALPAMSAGPYEQVFGDPRFETELFPAIVRDAEELEADTRDVDAFLRLPAVTALRESLEPSANDANIAAVTAAAFHGYHFWLNGRRTFALDESTLRALLHGNAAPIGVWDMDAPSPAGYVTLPRNIVWADPGTGKPEPVDGFFFTRQREGIAFLLTLGVRGDRAGFTAIEIVAPVPAPPPGHFGDIRAREDGADFQNVLAGGELRALLSLTNAGEVLKMTSRVMHHLQQQDA